MRERAGEAFEERLADVVRQFAVFQRHVQIHAGIVRDRLKEMFNELAVEFSDLGLFPFHLPYKVRTVAEVESDIAEALIHGQIKFP